MKEEEIKSSREKTVLLLLVCLTFVAISIAIPGQSIAEIYMSWAAGAFFGLCSVVFVWLLIRPQRLLLAPTGFTVAGGRVLFPKQILWRDVDPFFVYRVAAGAKAIGYNFSPGARKGSIMLRMNRVAGAEGGLLNIWPGTEEQMVERINTYRAQALAEDPHSSGGAA